MGGEGEGGPPSAKIKGYYIGRESQVLRTGEGGGRKHPLK